MQSELLMLSKETSRLLMEVVAFICFDLHAPGSQCPYVMHCQIGTILSALLS